MTSLFRRALRAAPVVFLLTLSTSALAAAPPPPATFSVTYTYSAGKYRFTATWSASAGATVYHLMGHVYNGPSTSISWTVPDNYEDLSIEYSVYACNTDGCSTVVGPQYADWAP